MVPPEVVLDRWIKSQTSWMGKLDIEQVEQTSLRPFLYFVQDAMNKALRSETTGASGGVPHPPFHFDYIKVDDNTANAYAFQHGGFSFIVVTLPLVELLWRLGQILGGSPSITHLLHLKAEARPETLQAVLFQLQLSFLVSHEYTHHIHQHLNRGEEGVTGVWTEFIQDETCGSIDSQVEELDADAYAIYLVLAHFIRGVGRQSVLSQLGWQDLPSNEADELLLTCFFLAVTAFFCARWPERIAMTSIGRLKHPPAPVRIEYAIRVAKMWCGQNRSVPESWFSEERLKSLFRVVAEAIGGTTREAWDAHILFLRSDEGAEYDRRLFERFEAVRQRR